MLIPPAYRVLACNLEVITVALLAGRGASQLQAYQTNRGGLLSDGRANF